MKILSTILILYTRRHPQNLMNPPLLDASASDQERISPADGAEADMPGFTHRYAQVNGTRIHYVTGGRGPSVVLLHGWPYT